MKPIKRVKQLQSIADQYEGLVKSGGVVWSDVDVNDLPDGTMEYVRIMLVEAGISFQVGEPKLGGTILFKLDDPLVGFLHHDRILGVHLWVDRRFDIGLHNESVFNYLIAKKVDLGVLSRDAVDKFTAKGRFYLEGGRDESVGEEEEEEEDDDASVEEWGDGESVEEPDNQFSSKRSLWELREFAGGSLIAKGDLGYITNQLLAIPDGQYGVSHFLIPTNAYFKHMLRKPAS
jgi:hypothetical protein